MKTYYERRFSYVKKIKKTISTLFIAIILTLSIAVPVSAACPRDGSQYIQNFCSGELEHVESGPCPWAGGSGGGYYHPKTCQIIRYYNYTGETCSKCSYSNNMYSTHLCHAVHAQAGIYIDACRY